MENNLGPLHKTHLSLQKNVALQLLILVVFFMHFGPDFFISLMTNSEKPVPKSCITCIDAAAFKLQ